MGSWRRPGHPACQNRRHGTGHGCQIRLTPPWPHSKVRSTISQRAAAITMPSSPHAKVTGTTANLPFGEPAHAGGQRFQQRLRRAGRHPRAYTADDEGGQGRRQRRHLHAAPPHVDPQFLHRHAGRQGEIPAADRRRGNPEALASSLDFGLENGGAETVASLSTTDQSNIIALQYTPDRASADKVEAFFNVPASTPR